MAMVPRKPGVRVGSRAVGVDSVGQIVRRGKIGAGEHDDLVVAVEHGVF